MKDKEARKNLKQLYNETREIRGELERITDRPAEIEVRSCPKCKHRTPQTKGYKGYIWAVNYDYLCLVCGSKLECTKETVCRVVKEEK